MPIFTVRHITSYAYRKPVGFGEHRMMLRPRDDVDQTVLDCALEIDPPPCELSWSQDDFGNHFATARFATTAPALRFDSTVTVRHAAVPFCPEDISDFARTYPYEPLADNGSSRTVQSAPGPEAVEVHSWAQTFLGADGSAPTAELIADMTKSIKATFTHRARHEHGIQDPLRTLTIRRGSCRDVAMLMIAGLRSLGFQARFASGYLYLADADADDDHISGGNTHAWLQVYLPGPGWVDIDPSSGTIGNQNLVRVAVAYDPSDAVPLQGTWVGSARDHLALDVAVRVRATHR